MRGSSHLDFFANEFELVVSGYKGLKGFLLLGVFFFGLVRFLWSHDGGGAT